MIEKLDEIGSKALEQIRSETSLNKLSEIRVSVLGKKGALSSVLRGLGQVDHTERPKIGAKANEWKARIEKEISQRSEVLEGQELDQAIQKEKVDYTLPARAPHLGHIHPITQAQRKIVSILSRLGFEVAVGPEVETEYLNFDSINIPASHPARDMQDTFFVGPQTVLRTHTSPVQMRTMLNKKWPVRILCPGAVYRCDNDATHSPMFHQVEGLWVDKGVRMSDLKGTLQYMACELFGSDTKIRMRPSYFPFVEPGVEVDVSWRDKNGNLTWLEILGAGMVHPFLYESAGYKSREISGFAFGIGIERVAMLLYGIPDLRLLFQNDQRFLKQF